VTQTLAGTVALVTGASSGIGEVTARALAAHGVAVSVVARRKDRLDSLVEQIGGDGGRALAIEADITEEGCAAAVVARTVEEFDRLDILVNNAGVMLLGPIVDAPREEWRRMIDLNVRALIDTSHAALPHLLAAAEQEPRHVADIINVSSVAGRVARENSGVYNLTKWGVGAFTESLRQEVTRRYVRVSLVEPGATATELATHLRPEIADQMRERFAGTTPLAATDISDAIVYIVTRERNVAVNEVLVRPTGQAF
jgi:NADP-dependent 3-hydroxy acid dehydrogenase YdfG